MNLLKVISLVLGTAETVVPIFIHNPQSQQIEGVVVTTLNGVLQGLSATPAAKPADKPVAE
jgi:hypothetical protein